MSYWMAPAGANSRARPVAAKEAAPMFDTLAIASRADLAALEARICRAMLIQTGAMLAGVAALIRMFG